MKWKLNPKQLQLEQIRFVLVIDQENNPLALCYDWTYYNKVSEISYELFQTIYRVNACLSYVNYSYRLFFLCFDWKCMEVHVLVPTLVHNIPTSCAAKMCRVLTRVGRGCYAQNDVAPSLASLLCSHSSFLFDKFYLQSKNCFRGKMFWQFVENA